MIHVEIIVGCIAFGALYSLIFERPKSNHSITLRIKKRPDRHRAPKNKLKNIKIRDYCITKRSNYEGKKSVCQN